jgi:hypothetical protein
MPADPTRRRDVISIALVLVLAVLLIDALGASYCNRDRQQARAEFEAKRHAWSQRCVPVRTAGRETNPALYDACQKELDELVAETKRKLW